MMMNKKNKKKNNNFNLINGFLLSGYIIHPSLTYDTLKVLKLAGNPALIVKV